MPRITGQPYEEPGRGRSARLLRTVDAIRRALITYDLPSGDAPPRSVSDLARDVRHVSDLGRAANYVAIGETLPSLLEDLSIAIHASSDQQKPRLFALLASPTPNITSSSPSTPRTSATPPRRSSPSASKWIPLADIRALIAKGDITSGTSLAALLYAAG